MGLLAALLLPSLGWSVAARSPDLSTPTKALGLYYTSLDSLAFTALIHCDLALRSVQSEGNAINAIKYVYDDGNTARDHHG